MARYIWAVEQGAYSDYRVVGVFSSRANAKKVADVVNRGNTDGYDEASVTRWVLDPIIDELNKGYTPWFVSMRKDGTMEQVEIREVPCFGLVSSFDVWDRPRASIHKGEAAPPPAVLMAHVWAKDVHHAVKIADEQRVQFIATGKWPKD